MTELPDVGRYYLRVGDTCQPVVGDDVLRLATERPSTPWETLTHLGVSVRDTDVAKTTNWYAAIRASDRVKASVREKSDGELLEHYGLSVGRVLTNLGVLLIGKAADRARLGSAPVVQAIRLDAQGKKVGKLSWDDHTLSPIELLDAIWTEVPDFRESYEVPDGMFRVSMPAFEESVVRELLVNALVHRPYTQRGDIYLNLDPEKLEVVNPGRLPSPWSRPRGWPHQGDPLLCSTGSAERGWAGPKDDAQTSRAAPVESADSRRFGAVSRLTHIRDSPSDRVGNLGPRHQTSLGWPDRQRPPGEGREQPLDHLSPRKVYRPTDVRRSIEQGLKPVNP